MSAETDSLVALIKTVPAALRTWVTIVPKDAPRDKDGKVVTPYVMVHPSRGTNRQTRVTGPRSSRNPRWTLHIVGSSVDQVEALTDQIEGKCFPAGRGAVLTVPGWRCFPMSWSIPTPLQVDNDLTPPLIYQVVELGMTAEPI